MKTAKLVRREIIFAILKTCSTAERKIRSAHHIPTARLTNFRIFIVAELVNLITSAMARTFQLIAHLTTNLVLLNVLGMRFCGVRTSFIQNMGSVRDARQGSHAMGQYRFQFRRFLTTTIQRIMIRKTMILMKIVATAIRIIISLQAMEALGLTMEQ